MKRAFVLLFVFVAAIALPLFADDALVLPKGVLRTYLTTAYAFGDQKYDADGEKVDSMDLKALNVGFAMEYGVNDWITAAAQWAPGWTLWSKTDVGFSPLPYTSDVKVNGLYDLFLGAKLQIVGPKAPVASQKFRVAVAPGVKIPMPDADWDEQVDNLSAGDDVVLSSADKHAFGIGARAYCDYVINEMFFMNLYSEFIKYFERKDAEGISVFPLGTTKQDIAYGYDLTLEFEPHFELPLANSAKFSASLPLTYKMTPEIEYDGTAKADSDTTSLSLTPSVSYFFLAGALPFEAKLGYAVPLMGTNTTALNRVVFQFKSYLKF